MTARYAIYYAPAPNSKLWELGSQWLGRDAVTEEPLEQPSLAGLSAAESAAITERPRRYGFHATLKAPFRLEAGSCEDDLRKTLHSFSEQRRRFEVMLKLGQIDGFLALVPKTRCDELDQLAADCVRIFESFRARLSESECARRLSEDLSPRERVLLKRWGYPYVMDKFRFHMTLTGSLSEPSLAMIGAGLQQLFASTIDRPVLVDAICLCVQNDHCCDFRILERYEFGA